MIEAEECEGKEEGKVYHFPCRPWRLWRGRERGGKEIDGNSLLCQL